MPHSAKRREKARGGIKGSEEKHMAVAGQGAQLSLSFSRAGVAMI